MSPPKSKTTKKNRARSAIIKNEFIHTTYPVITDLSNGTMTMSEYMCAFINARGRATAGPRSYFIVLYSCPREPGALRKLKERVTTYVIDTDTNHFQHWMETMCAGSQSYVEPNMMIGPFDGALHPAKKTLQRVKDRLATTRGVAQRVIYLSEIAKEYHVMTYGGIRPLLTSADINQLYAAVSSVHHAGIFETAPRSSAGTGS